MTDRELPDDMQSWPSEAHELLGVERFGDERSLKRAYTRLIRRFKPDHHPQQFARIRAAYEELQRNIEWRAKFDHPPTEQIISLEQLLEPQLPADQIHRKEAAGSDSPIPPAVKADPDQEKGTEQLGPSGSDQASPIADSGRELADDMSLAWQIACRGDATAGYHKLVQVHDRHRGSEELCLRLYWLLRCYPDLDPQRERTDWLVEPLRQRLSGRAWVLYRAEVQRRPELALSAGNDRLRSSSASPGQLYEFLSVRWRAVADLEAWELILSDLDSFKPLLILDSTIIWARLLFLATDLAVWSSKPRARQLRKQTQIELNSLTELQLELINEFERYDTLMEISRTLIELPHSPLPPEIVAVLRASWLDSYYELRPTLQSLLDQWMDRPGTALKGLDNLRRAYPPVFHRLRTTISGCDISESLRENPEHQAEQRRLIVDFLMPYSNLDYHQSLRWRLLDFCIEHHLTLSAVQAVFDNPPIRLKSQITPEMLTEDLPLAVILMGIAAYRS